MRRIIKRAVFRIVSRNMKMSYLMIPKINLFGISPRSAVTVTLWRDVRAVAARQIKRTMCIGLVPWIGVYNGRTKCTAKRAVCFVRQPAVFYLTCNIIQLISFFTTNTRKIRFRFGYTRKREHSFTGGRLPPSTKKAPSSYTIYVH